MKAINGAVHGFLVIAALNWGLVGLFGLDVVATMFGWFSETLVRIMYLIFGLAGLYGIYLIYPLVRGSAQVAREDSLMTHRRRRQSATNMP